MVVVGDGEVEVGFLGNWSSKAGVTVCHTEADGLRQGSGGEVEFVDEGCINKGFLSA